PTVASHWPSIHKPSAADRTLTGQRPKPSALHGHRTLTKTVSLPCPHCPPLSGLTPPPPPQWPDKRSRFFRFSFFFRFFLTRNFLWCTVHRTTAHTQRATSGEPAGREPSGGASQTSRGFPGEDARIT